MEKEIYKDFMSTEIKYKRVDIPYITNVDNSILLTNSDIDILRKQARAMSMSFKTFVSFYLKQMLNQNML